MKNDNKLLWDDFKIWKLIEGNCKISCICVFLFSITQYIQVFFKKKIKFLFNLSFLMIPLEKIPRAANGFWYEF